jgi:6-phosphogluconolactonase
MSTESRLVFPDGDALARAAATKILQLAGESISQRGVFSLALSGGSTPKKLYQLLATEPEFRDFPWDQTQLYFGDERHVPPDDKDSNFLMTKSTLLTSPRVPAAHLHRVRAELPSAADAAAQYEADLRVFFTAEKCLGGFPRFDVVLLGMGPDGHTASLFPGSKGLAETKPWVIANWVEKFKTDRITFTFPVINAARNVLLLIGGADKTNMLHEILVSKRGQHAYPVQSVAPVEGNQVWMLDQAAAAKLPAA